MDPLALRSLIESTTSCTVDSYMKTYSGIATFFRTKYDPGFSATDIANGQIHGKMVLRASEQRSRSQR